MADDELVIKLRSDIGELAEGLKQATKKLEGFSATTVAKGILAAGAITNRSRSSGNGG